MMIMMIYMSPKLQWNQTEASVQFEQDVSTHSGTIVCTLTSKTTTFILENDETDCGFGAIASECILYVASSEEEVKSTFVPAFSTVTQRIRSWSHVTQMSFLPGGVGLHPEQLVALSGSGSRCNSFTVKGAGELDHTPVKTSPVGIALKGPCHEGGGSTALKKRKKISHWMSTVPAAEEHADMEKEQSHFHICLRPAGEPWPWVLTVSHDSFQRVNSFGCAPSHLLSIFDC